MVTFTTKENKRAFGAELDIINEPWTVPSSSPFTVKLIEVPYPDSPSSVSIPGFVETTSSSPGIGKFYVNYSSGYLTFNSADADTPVFVSYRGRGSIVDAVDVDTIQTILAEIANEVITSRGSLSSLDDRLDVSLNNDGTLASHVVVPSTISISASDNFVFPAKVSMGALHFPSTPGSPSIGDVWYNSVDDQFYGQAAAGIVVLG